jgi:hypothetical protein
LYKNEGRKDINEDYPFSRIVVWLLIAFISSSAMQLIYNDYSKIRLPGVMCVYPHPTADISRRKNARMNNNAVRKLIQ